MNRRDAIEAAFRRLPLLGGTEVHLKGAVNILADTDCTGPGSTSRQFSVVGRTRTKKELEKLAKLAAELAGHIDTLHQPAILALADMGLWRARLELPASLRAIANLAPRADLSMVPESPSGGKPANKRAHAVATMLAYYYHLLTGKDPTRRIDAYSDDTKAQGPFVTLVESIFSAIGIHANTEDIARAAIARYRNARSKPPQSQ